LFGDSQITIDFTEYRNTVYIIEEELQIEEIQHLLQPPSLPVAWQNPYFNPSTSEDSENLHKHLIASDESVSRSLLASIFKHRDSFFQHAEIHRESPNGKEI
jgi:hypothetical protein